MSSVHKFSSDELALLAAIHANPRDDLPRLVWADWLDEHDEPLHAEFVRLQCGDPFVILPSRYDAELVYSEIYVDYSHRHENVGKYERLLAMFVELRKQPRYSLHMKQRYFEEQVRGLPIVQIPVEGGPISHGDKLLAEIGPLPRVDLWLHAGDNLSDWIAHPLLQRVDVLRVWPEDRSDLEPDEDGTMNFYTDEWWSKNVPILADSPLLDRLVRLDLCQCHSAGEVTELSAENMALCEEFIAPRVPISFWG